MQALIEIPRLYYVSKEKTFELTDFSKLALNVDPFGLGLDYYVIDPDKLDSQGRLVCAKDEIEAWWIVQKIDERREALDVSEDHFFKLRAENPCWYQLFDETIVDFVGADKHGAQQKASVRVAAYRVF